MIVQTSNRRQRSLRFGLPPPSRACVLHIGESLAPARDLGPLREWAYAGPYVHSDRRNQQLRIWLQYSCNRSHGRSYFMTQNLRLHSESNS